MKILERILAEKGNRMRLIQEFQSLVWNNKNVGEILSELAYDLDFYEPNKEWQKEDVIYYGDKELECKIKAVIEKLKHQ